MTIAGVALLLASGQHSVAQCPNNNNPIAGAAITPPCPGTVTVNCVNGGQYALVNVTAGNIYVFSTCNGTVDTRITLYNNAGGGSLGYNDDFCGLQSQVTWVASFTGQLRVLVDRYLWYNTCAHSGGCQPVDISCSLPPPPVTNNNCNTPIDLPVIQNCFVQNFSNVGANASSTTPMPTCSSAPNTDVWFRFIAPASGVVFIESNPVTLNDGAMQLYTGNCTSMALVPNGCDDDSGPGLAPYLETRCNRLTPFATYYIRYWGYGGSTGIFSLCVRGEDVFPTPQEDCVGGATICNSQQISNNANWTGCTVDLNTSNRGCLLGNERQGTWYYFSPQATGTIGFDMIPTGAGGTPVGVDYDFAIWGPMSSTTCPPSGNPLRCTWAYPPNVPGYPGVGAYQTGMGNGAADASENEYGNGYVAPINVGAGQVGQIYVMYVDNFDITGQSFQMNWNLSTPGMLDCTVLPVELVDFRAMMNGGMVDVSWTTQTETGTESFIVEHSMNGTDFEAIGSIPAAGHSVGNIDYLLQHREPLAGINYYRLKQLDQDGSYVHSQVAPVIYKPGRHVLLPRPNPATSSVQVDLPTGYEGEFQLAILDASGRIVTRNIGRTAIGPSFVELPLHGLEAGSYVVELRSSTGEALGTGRFMKY